MERCRRLAFSVDGYYDYTLMFANGKLYHRTAKELICVAHSTNANPKDSFEK